MSLAQDEPTWTDAIARVGLNALTHPLEYAKVLIQIGHEPLAPYKSRNIFWRDTYYYPNVFKYIAHIKRTDGFFGCYRGLGPKLCGNVVSGLAFQRVTERIKFKELDEPIKKGDQSIEESDELTAQQRTQKFLQNTMRETAGRTASIILSQPFHVIAIRTMAEFVGNDGHYTTIFTSIAVVYREEGVSGFFSGLVPRIICDIGALWLASLLTHVVNNYVVDDKDIEGYIRASVGFITSALMYPMQLVANCMAVTGSGLVAGQPPKMPVYPNWRECYKHLRQIRGLKRGSSLLWRPYPGGSVLLNERLGLASEGMFKIH